MGNGVTRTNQRRGSNGATGDPLLLELISNIYRTPLEPGIWPGLLKQIADLTGAAMGVQAIVDLGQRKVTYHWGHNAPAELAPAKQHHVDNPWSRASFRFPFGTTLLTEDLVPADELRDSELYREVLAPHRIGCGIGSNLLHEEGKTALFSLFRPAGQGGFSQNAQSLVGLLVPHIQRATQLFLRLQRSELQLAAAHRVMEQLNLGVLLVDERGRVSFSNPSANRILRASDGLVVEDGEIRAMEPDEGPQLARLVGEAVRTGTGHGTGPGGALAISRPSGKQPLQLLIAPLSDTQEILPGLKRAAAAVFVSDPEVEPEGSMAVLERLYDLTPSEARVAVGVVAGRGLQDVADAIGVGLNTVRTHLQHVFQKTGTRRQAELVQLLLRGPLQLRIRANQHPPAGS